MNNKLDFTHLHVHCERGSILDGIIKIDELPDVAQQYSMSAIGLTDHGNLNGILSFYESCRKKSIKPIIGVEAYLTLDDDNLPKDLRTRDNYHIILIAKNNIGYQNLLYLLSNAAINNFYYKPRISLKKLQEHSEGLIGNSACLAGLCAKSASYDSINDIYIDPHHKAEQYIGMFKEIFHGNFQLELMDNSMAEQIAYNKFLIEMSKKTNCDLIITADAHYLNKEDEDLHTVLMAMQSKQTLEEYKNEGYFHYENCYIRPPQEMLLAAQRVGAEQAFYNTLKISEMCNVDIKLGEYKIPIFNIKEDPDYEDYIKWKKTQVL